MSIIEIADQVKTKEDFVNFLEKFIEDFQNNKDYWENVELGRYFEAMEAFLHSSTDKSINKIDFTPSWSLFANILVTASIYE